MLPGQEEFVLDRTLLELDVIPGPVVANVLLQMQLYLEVGVATQGFCWSHWAVNYQIMIGGSCFFFRIPPFWTSKPRGVWKTTQKGLIIRAQARSCNFSEICRWPPLALYRCGPFFTHPFFTHSIHYWAWRHFCAAFKTLCAGWHCWGRYPILHFLIKSRRVSSQHGVLFRCPATIWGCLVPLILRIYVNFSRVYGSGLASGGPTPKSGQTRVA